MTVIRRWAKPVLLTLVGLIVVKIVFDLVTSIDWGAVWDAIGLVGFWAAVLLIGTLAVRQTFNAVPLTRFVPGLTLARSIQNDLTALLMGTVAPPPSDVVVRVSQFKSWGIDPVEGMAGVTLNMLTFYVVRFGAPAFGILVLALYGLETGQSWRAFTSTLIAVVILAALISLSRGEALAATLGHAAGRVVGRFRSDVDPHQWSTAVVDFRAKVGDRVRTGVPTSLLALFGMVVAETVMVVLAVRAVGVSAAELSTLVIVGTFLLAYPLTLFPLMGLGIIDAALVAAWTQIAGEEVGPSLVAGLIVWRAFSLLLPFCVGLGALALWRRDVRESERSGRARAV